MPDNQGNVYIVKLKDFRKTFPIGDRDQVYRTLRGLVSFAIKRDYIEGLDPMRGIDNPRPYRPGPVNAANDAELVALFRTLESSALWPTTTLAIELQLLTGVRPGEARLASWDEIDLAKATWTIPSERVKSGRMFIVHLSRAALALLERARDLRGLNSTRDGGPDDFVLPGAAGRPLEKVAVARALARIAERLSDGGGKRLRPHDLRRTFRTMLSRLGIAAVALGALWLGVSAWSCIRLGPVDRRVRC